MEEKFKEIRRLAEEWAAAACSRPWMSFEEYYAAGKPLEEAVTALELDVANHLGHEAYYRERFSVAATALADLAEAVLNSSWDEETRGLARDCLWRVLLTKEKK